MKLLNKAPRKQKIEEKKEKKEEKPVHFSCRVVCELLYESRSFMALKCTNN